jgi:hypothetical protein
VAGAAGSSTPLAMVLVVLAVWRPEWTEQIG